MKLVKDSDFLYKRNEIQGDEFIFYSHLGLGDQIILSGGINYLSKKYKKIHIVSYEKFKNSLDLLYKDNANIEIFYLPKNMNKLTQENQEIPTEVIKYSKKTNLEILKIGYDKKNKRLHFSKAFYKQLKLNYKFSYKYFTLNNDQSLVDKLTNHLKDTYKIKDNFKLIHNEHSSGPVVLKNINENNSIYITRETDPFNNIFLYEGLIKDAEEIHCINSSFAHLVDRLDTNGKLFYHEILGSRLPFVKKWEYVNYL